MGDRAREIRGFRTDFLFALIFLVIQFLLGMAVNLFITIPKNHPGSNPSEYFGGVVQSVTWAILNGPLLLILHASVGLILVIGAFGILYRAARLRKRGAVWAASVGAIAVLSAGFNGGSFLNYHEDFSSMIMAAFFAVAVVAYGAGMYVCGGDSA